jgi:hypothetical protein
MSLNRNNDGRVSNAETDPFIFGMNSQLRFYRHIICAPGDLYNWPYLS